MGNVNMSNKTKWIVIIFLLVSMIVAGWLYLNFGGRSASRIIGKSAREVINFSDMQQMVGNVNMWFDHIANKTVKDITFCSTDGYYYTYEYRELSLFEGVIRWVPHGDSSSLIRSRFLSRMGFSAVNLTVPDDFKGLFGVTIVASGEQRIKNLTYLNTKDQILAKEYRDGLTDRFFGGYLEVKGSEKPVVPQSLCDQTYRVGQAK